MRKLDEKFVNLKLYPNGKPAEAAQAGMLLTLYYQIHCKSISCNLFKAVLVYF